MGIGISARFKAWRSKRMVQKQLKQAERVNINSLKQSMKKTQNPLTRQLTKDEIEFRKKGESDGGIARMEQ